MIHGRRPPPQGVRKKAVRKQPFRDRAFMNRLVGGLSLGFIGCLLAFAIPVIFLVQQNYNAFIALAYDVKPSLVRHLERERTWLFAFLLTAGLATIGVLHFFIRRLLREVFTPLENLEEHLRSTSKGRWHAPTPSANSLNDESLFLSYVEFHRTLRQLTEDDLRMLEKLVVDPAHREAFAAWKALMENHRLRLGYKPPPPSIVTSESSDEALPSRRVS